MTIKDRPRPQRIRLFRNKWLELLTVVTPRDFAAIWFVMLSLALYASWGTASLGMSIGLVLLGIVAWSLFEYVMHRFLFHLRMRSEIGQYVIFVMHGNHHVQPDDPDRNMMPPIISLPWSAAIWGAFLLFCGPVGSLLFLGFAIGYVVYDGVHYACHQFPMRGPVLRQLKRHHIRHHHARREGNFAITAIFWDWMFRTELRFKGR